jgi:methyl-galactoside transport system substrate-binding protein
MGKEVINEPFAVINGDDYYGKESFRILGDWLRAHEGKTGEYALVGFELDNTLSESGGVSRGIGTADEAGNVLTDDVYRYDDENRSYYALNVAVTSDNYKDYLDSTVPYKPVSNKLDKSAHKEKKVWLNIYNSADNFLGSTYQPLLQNYDDLLNLKVEYIGGDGQTESNITNKLGNPSQYDAFAINMVKTDNAASYTSILIQ